MHTLLLWVFLMTYERPTQVGPFTSQEACQKVFMETGKNIDSAWLVPCYQIVVTVPDAIH